MFNKSDLRRRTNVTPFKKEMIHELTLVQNYVHFVYLNPSNGKTYMSIPSRKRHLFEVEKEKQINFQL